MSISLEKLLCYDYFKGLTLIAGRGGLSRPVSGCGVLDYELDRSLNPKYAALNFPPEKLVISSLMFAKDSPFMIRDAVKYLISKNASGFVIKNVFRIPIHESIIRYADSKDFPIFLMDDTQMFFEDFIIQTDKCVEIAENAEFISQELNKLLHQNLSSGEKEVIIRRIFPVFYDQYVLIYFDTLSTEVSLSQATAKLQSIHVSEVTKSILRYEKGFFLFLSGDAIPTNVLDTFILPLSDIFPNCSIGISNVHFRMEHVDQSLYEAIQAALVHKLEKKGLSNSSYLSYSQIGIYQALLPLINNEFLQQYSDSLLEPILEFDAENRGNLMETLLAFVQCGGDLHQIAKITGQHENTLRYRLDKIYTLTDLNYRKNADYEQLALAARVYLLLNEY